MAKKKQAKKPCNCEDHHCGGYCSGPLTIVTPSYAVPMIKRWAKEAAQDGLYVAVIVTGVPGNPPKCPPGGCL